MKKIIVMVALVVAGCASNEVIHELTFDGKPVRLSKYYTPDSCVVVGVNIDDSTSPNGLKTKILGFTTQEVSLSITEPSYGSSFAVESWRVAGALPGTRGFFNHMMCPDFYSELMEGRERLKMLDEQIQAEFERATMTTNVERIGSATIIDTIPVMRKR